MRKSLIITFSLLVLVLLLASSCIPELPDEPNEYPAFCKQMYQEKLQEDPNYPPAFIGACTAYFETGKASAFASLCRYEPFRQDLIDSGVEITHQKDCVQYLVSYEE